MSLALRPFVTGDAAASIDIYYDAIHNGTAPHYALNEREAWAPRDARPDPARWADRLGGVHTIVAEDSGAMVGFASLLGHGHIDMLFVRPAARKSGAAAALYDGLLEAARSSGVKGMTTDASHLARRFLEKRGWRVVAPEVVTRNGVKLTRFRMALDQLPDQSHRS